MFHIQLSSASSCDVAVQLTATYVIDWHLQTCGAELRFAVDIFSLFKIHEFCSTVHIDNDVSLL